MCLNPLPTTEDGAQPAVTETNIEFRGRFAPSPYRRLRYKTEDEAPPLASEINADFHGRFTQLSYSRRGYVVPSIDTPIVVAQPETNVEFRGRFSLSSYARLRHTSSIEGSAPPPPTPPPPPVGPPPPTQASSRTVSSISLPFLREVLDFDPTFERDKHNELFYPFGEAGHNARNFYGDPYTSGAYTPPGPSLTAPPPPTQASSKTVTSIAISTVLFNRWVAVD